MKRNRLAQFTLVATTFLTSLGCSQFGTPRFNAPLPQVAQEHTRSADSYEEYDSVPVPNWLEVHAIRQQGSCRFIVLCNSLSLIDAVWVKKSAWWHGTTSRIVCRFSTAAKTGPMEAALTYLKTTYSGACFQRPWMTQVAIRTYSPWLPSKAFVSSPNGYLLAELPLEVDLNAQQTRRLESFEANAFILGGQLSFLDADSGHYFVQSFSLRKSDLRISVQ
jgi:hypothetical protein